MSNDKFIKEFTLSRNMEMNDNRPYISVVITAFNRKTFLSRAIESIAKQTLNKNLYEVFIIKNFNDKCLDLLIDKYNFYSIILTTGEMTSIGNYILNIVKQTHGELISILEDDDYFYPERLAVLYNEFKKIGI